MLEELIEKFRKSFTTLTCLMVVLDKHINSLHKHLEFKGISNAEIGREYEIYRLLHNSKKNFYPSYIHRHNQDGDFFIEQNKLYFIRPELIANKSLDDLLTIKELINNLIEVENFNQSEIISDLDQILELNNLDENKAFIDSLFESDQFRNFGQVFEILSYSILKVYFESFGFTLNRFSTSFSNDGGMDFISALGIYQVTASPNKKKIESDLSKLPGTRRVMVFTECSDTLIQTYLNYPDVTEIIDINDLKIHFLDWLYKRDQIKQTYLNAILRTFREQLFREQ